MKSVTHDEFYEFIKNYPRKLDVDVVYFNEPPVKTWNDFTLGKWPKSIVASCRVFSDDPYYTESEKDYVDKGEYLENNWQIEKWKLSN